MKKKGMSLITKILLMIPIISSFIFGINGILIGIFREDYLARLVYGPILLPLYVVLGIFTATVAVILGIKTIKE